MLQMRWNPGFMELSGMVRHGHGAVYIYRDSIPQNVFFHSQLSPTFQHRLQLLKPYPNFQSPAFPVLENVTIRLHHRRQHHCHRLPLPSQKPHLPHHRPQRRRNRRRNGHLPRPRLPIDNPPPRPNTLKDPTNNRRHPEHRRPHQDQIRRSVPRLTHQRSQSCESYPR